MAEAVRIVVSELGRSATQARVRRWLKEVGEPVLAFEPLVELETDHATLELRAPAVGTLSAVTARQGEIVPVGAEIGTIAAGLSDTKWTVYGSAPGWRKEFPQLSRVAAWLGWKR